MAVNIAKLAILLTADTRNLAQGFNQASGLVKSFDARVNMSSSSLAGFASRATAVGLVIIAFKKLTRAGLEAADAATQAEAKVVRAFNEMQKAQGRTTGFQNDPDLDTFTFQWKKFKEDVGGTGASVFRPLSDALAQVLFSFREFGRDFNKDFRWLFGMSEGQSQRAKQLLAMAEATKQYNEELKVQAEREKAAQAEFQKRMRRAESITESLRLPAEVAADSIRELNTLWQQGLLNLETYNRGITEAKDRLTDAAKASRAFRTSGPTSGVAAVERFSTAAFSAIQAAKRQADQQNAIARDQLAVERQQQKELEAVNRALRDRPTVNLKVGKL